MRVIGPLPPPASASRPGVRRSDGSFAGLVDSGSTAPARATAAPVSVAVPAALLALQQEEDTGQRRQREMRRCGLLIDELDEIRRGLLMGSLSSQRLQMLARRLKQQDRAGLDPALSALVDDIELRVAVELAKLGIVTE